MDDWAGRPRGVRPAGLSSMVPRKSPPAWACRSVSAASRRGRLPEKAQTPRGGCNACGVSRQHRRGGGAGALQGWHTLPTRRALDAPRCVGRALRLWGLVPRLGLSDLHRPGACASRVSGFFFRCGPRSGPRSCSPPAAGGRAERTQPARLARCARGVGGGIDRAPDIPTGLLVERVSRVLGVTYGQPPAHP